MTAIEVIVALIVGVVGAAAGYFVGYNNRKKTAEAQIGSAEAEATRLVNEAIKTADQKRKEAVLEAKDEAFKLKAEVDAQKAEADKEIKQRRAEISRQENRIDQKENALDRKTEALERKEEDLKKRTAEADARLAEIDALRAKEMERLETLAGLSQEDAREVLLHKVDEELTHEKAVRIAAYETDLKENCDNIAAFQYPRLAQTGQPFLQIHFDSLALPVREIRCENLLCIFPVSSVCLPRNSPCLSPGRSVLPAPASYTLSGSCLG